jgi:hypothetical protein
LWQNLNTAKTQRSKNPTRQKPNTVKANVAKTQHGENPTRQKPNAAETKRGKNQTRQKPNAAKTPWFTISELGLLTYQ